jgi:hypothetical protein
MPDSQNYSIDTMIRYAFVYELNNLIKIEEKPLPISEEQRQIIKAYLEQRIEQITQKYK